MRIAGSSHKFAEMVVLQQAPSLQTDTRWLTGHHSANQFAGGSAKEECGKYYIDVAQRHGVITSGKVYKSGLARFPGDPEAWVSSRSEVKRLCERRNWDCEGSVIHRSVDTGPAPEAKPYRVAEDIVNAELEKITDTNPTALLDDPRLREKTANRLSGDTGE